MPLCIRVCNIYPFICVQVFLGKHASLTKMYGGYFQYGQVAGGMTTESYDAGGMDMDMDSGGIGVDLDLI
jgi:hypothetical protein